MIDEIKRNKILISQIYERIENVKKEIGITNLNANTLESIQDEVEKLKQKQIGISSCLHIIIDIYQRRK